MYYNEENVWQSPSQRSVDNTAQMMLRVLFFSFLGVVMKIVYHCWCDFCKEESEQDTPMNYCPNCGLGPPDIYLYVNKWNKRGQLVSTERR
jgi:hypothetical protein